LDEPHGLRDKLKGEACIMPTGRGMLDLARRHIDDKYENVLVPKDNPNWRGPWDCAEFMSWIVFQDAGVLYGCINDNAAPGVADAYTGSWKEDSARLGNRVPVDQGAAIMGGIALRFPPEPGTVGHIAICDGRGGTVEAKGHEFGVVADTVHGRRWDMGVLIPDVEYDTNITPLTLTQPLKLYHRGSQNMDPNVIRQIQQKLLDAKFDPGPIDGIYGPKTAAAVGAFQRVNGLVMDGEVASQTSEALAITL
jgi:hypothetical protein